METLACVSCDTSTIVAAPIKLQHFKITTVMMFIHGIIMRFKMAKFMLRNIVKEVGTEVTQFMGYSYLKPKQKQSINRIVSKRNVFEIVPTRFGKSLCYTSLPLI